MNASEYRSFLATPVSGNTLPQVGKHGAGPLPRSLNHLRMLEAESIHILRETAAQFERPVLMYSIGKDSSVMLHLARMAFFPGKIPFPLMHIDTGYEYPEMIAFRDWFVAEIGARLIAHTNQKALDNGVNPYSLGPSR